MSKTVQEDMIGTTIEVETHMYFKTKFPHNQISVSDPANSIIEETLSQVLKKVDSINYGVKELNCMTLEVRKLDKMKTQENVS